MNELIRAEIIAKGHVQGVGFRYFVYNKAVNLGLKGFTKNLRNGDVLTIVEGEEDLIDKLYELIKKGSPSSHVTSANILKSDYLNEFNKFDVGY